MEKRKEKLTERPPVVAIMGHIDHGKSTLLDYIRKANVTDKEVGGITQHIGAYEVSVANGGGKEHKITFLDTPGHEAFSAIRQRGIKVADVGILVVSAEDGVKPQTLEAVKWMSEDSLPFVVAINKIDKPEANIEKTKQNLAENEIFLENFGGNIPWTAISAKTGEGVKEILDLILIVAELEGLKGDTEAKGEGVIVESNLDTKKGISTTVIIKNGTVKRGAFAVSGKSISPLRILEDYQNKPIESATFSSPIKIIGWDSQPEVGSAFFCFDNKQDALKKAMEYVEKIPVSANETDETEKTFIPIIIKADVVGSLDAILHEIKKIESDRVRVKTVLCGIGPVSENDIKSACVNDNALVIAFNTKVDSRARSMALRQNIIINEFDIIYKLTEWLALAIKDKTPSVEVEEVSGQAKILKIFSRVKDKQVIGGRVESGSISSGKMTKIFRRGVDIGEGKIKELQQQKQKTGTIEEGAEFGALIESRTEIAPGDKIEVYVLVKK
ncbi:MAG: translation initiation factor IF-2 [Candidatus Zambryskibacteria bacterium CG_4_9_14_3_um_filter_40_16]|uniref:Translation initiation factor IF-2 n=2 Tax=Candidatus Zambryskiibacteriota TaxID=1817925 RepID=A0A2H0K7E2_9BACT|nr:MAG: translation initiation factor IF-2 [Candidatus Zambryskibacteria bacterium CG11_big_fil_rev_8_21_14_0_20_40_24]PJA33828.1 MAG: translation initiation factor IF-2 [Candidatus Zambryskibacteria bacterium CG_4_9_14_3_um_filter_40_16]